MPNGSAKFIPVPAMIPGTIARARATLIPTRTIHWEIVSGTGTFKINIITIRSARNARMIILGNPNARILFLTSVMILSSFSGHQ